LFLDLDLQRTVTGGLFQRHGKAHRSIARSARTPATITPNKRPAMPFQVSQVVEWMERLIDEKIRLEAINSRRDELLKRNVGKELINAGIEESRKKIAQAKTELMSLLQQLEQK
jgi:hypothetical protein